MNEPQTCYMCDQPATTKEHVPPKCLFPEQKDLLEGARSLRENLITVPSCETHNTLRSRDDEHLLYFLSMHLANNSTAFRQFHTKIIRSYQRNPALMKWITEDSKKLIAVDSKGKAMLSLQVKPDADRLSRCFDNIANGLYFHQYGESYSGGPVRSLQDIAADPTNKDKVYVDNGVERNDVLTHLREHFAQLEHEGSNPDVFRYKFERPDANGIISLHMQFYRGCNIFCAFSPEKYVSKELLSLLIHQENAYE